MLLYLRKCIIEVKSANTEKMHLTDKNIKIYTFNKMKCINFKLDLFGRTSNIPCLLHFLFELLIKRKTRQLNFFRIVLLTFLNFKFKSRNYKKNDDKFL